MTASPGPSQDRLAVPIWQQWASKGLTGGRSTKTNYETKVILLQNNDCLVVRKLRRMLIFYQVCLLYRRLCGILNVVEYENVTVPGVELSNVVAPVSLRVFAAETYNQTSAQTNRATTTTKVIPAFKKIVTLGNLRYFVTCIRVRAETVTDTLHGQT